MRKLLLLGLALLPVQVEAQEKAGRMMLEAGVGGGSGDACPGRYVGIKGRVAGPVSLCGMIETYRCADFAGSANRIGTSVRLGRARWFVRRSSATGQWVRLYVGVAERRREPMIVAEFRS